MKKDELNREWQKAAEAKIPGGLSLEKHNILLETLCDIMAAELLNAGGEIRTHFIINGYFLQPFSIKS